ncbi:phosphoadenosine phosphosulfate reductase family protein [Lentzea sp. NPDC092896]|uniref:phosphoadenosine phosphosulfate reductase domain-containing protein n=1 Tax=Lentzea sp. NPDC092896 TaxID=3364127 RepID=UPI0038074092
MTSKGPQTLAEQDGVRALVAPYVHGAGKRQMCLFDLIAPAPPAGFAPEPELASYDWILFNSSGGKDSQVALSHGVALADAAGVDRSRIVVVYADLGRVVWPQTREIAEAQAGMLGVRFEVVSREKGDLLDYVIDKNRRRVADGKTGTQTLSWPSASARWCTSDLKTGPVAKLMTRLVAETRLQRPSHRVRVLNCLGIRAEESPHRARKTAFGPDPATWSSAREGSGSPRPHSKREVDRWLPIFTWTRAQVWKEIRRSGLPWHWAYQFVDRLSCIECVMSPFRQLVIGAYFNPELALAYQSAEAATGHSFKPDLTMTEVIDAARTMPPPRPRDPFQLAQA